MAMTKGLGDCDLPQKFSFSPVFPILLTFLINDDECVADSWSSLLTPFTRRQMKANG